ncbi:hypothetical protein CI238_07098, partial [Colletotrichum incanum]
LFTEHSGMNSGVQCFNTSNGATDVNDLVAKATLCSTLACLMEAWEVSLCDDGVTPRVRDKEWTKRRSSPNALA